MGSKSKDDVSDRHYVLEKFPGGIEGSKSSLEQVIFNFLAVTAL